MFYKPKKLLYYKEVVALGHEVNDSLLSSHPVVLDAVVSLIRRQLVQRVKQAVIYLWRVIFYMN